MAVVVSLQCFRWLLNLNLVDDAPSLDIIPWKLSVPAVRFDLASFKKDTTKPEIYNQLYLQLISEYPLSEQIFTDGSKTEEGVAAAAVSTKRMKKTFTCQLPDDSSIYTAELRAILLALKHVHYSKGKSFLILSDSLSSLQSILNLKYDHPVLVQILELYTKMTRERGERLFSSGFPAMLALGEILLQILQLRMPLMATSRLSSSHSQT